MQNQSDRANPYAWKEDDYKVFHQLCPAGPVEPVRHPTQTPLKDVTASHQNSPFDGTDVGNVTQTPATEYKLATLVGSALREVESDTSGFDMPGTFEFVHRSCLIYDCL